MVPLPRAAWVIALTRRGHCKGYAEPMRGNVRYGTYALVL